MSRRSRKLSQYMWKPPYATNVGARFIVHLLHYMFRPLLVAIFRWFVTKNSKAVTVYVNGSIGAEICSVISAQ
jgi:hypothetical protein